jgi:hypothetical protein
MQIRILYNEKTGCSVIIVLFAFTAFGQDKSDRMKLGLFSTRPHNFEYMEGKLKEIHYRSFHISEEKGKIVKGKPFTWSDADGVQSRQHSSYYYSESGQMVKISGTADPDIHWTGVVHYENNRIENIYWLKGDTLMFNWDIVYPGNGNVERQWISVQNNEPTGKQAIVLDKNGHVVKEMNYNGNGELSYTGEYTRNETVL